ncbi:hypothetical protein Goari_005411 [Gossypium aridum]|uniref:Uncharacterized protein n=1 Tax=Gossypium aridum TaxID=34290 RepID=A0A7J8Y869_GOSAI|nr:hypothetical protein [Gossypium aridum]
MPMSTLYFNALVYRTRVKRGIAPDMYPEANPEFSLSHSLFTFFSLCRSMKAKIMATYPDAFPDESTREVFDQRPDLEAPQ